MPSDHVLFSAAPDAYGAAVLELRRALDVHQVKRVGDDAGLLELASGSFADAVRACQGDAVRFVRHLSRAHEQVPSATVRFDADAVVELASRVAEDAPRTGSLAVQAWDSGRADHSPEALRRKLCELLAEHGRPTVRSGADVTLSLCLGEKLTVAGLARRGESLCDWPGGRLRLANRPGRISRAELKLEELFQLTDVTVPDPCVALDLGASPGGWTRVLREHGATVHAVDPADLDERLAGDRGVVHERVTAGTFLERTDLRFDLVVNDMRMVPSLSVQLMLDAARRVVPGGLAVMTLKIGRDRPVPDVDHALEQLTRSYEVVFARQLQHNRHEVTVVARRRR